MTKLRLDSFIYSFIHQMYTEHLDFVFGCCFLSGTLLGAQRALGGGFMRMMDLTLNMETLKHQQNSQAASCR